MNTNIQDLEISLLAALSNRASFEQYYSTLETKRLLNNTALLLKDYVQYFTKFSEDEQIDFTNKFYTCFANTWHRKDMDEQDIAYYRDTVFPLIQNCRQEDIKIILRELQHNKMLDELQKVTQSVTFGDSASFLKCQELLEKIKHEDVEDIDVHTIDKVDFTAFDIKHGLPWFLPSLVKSNGNIQRGQLIIVCAYSDVGKGAFCISQTAAVLKAKMGPVLYFTSEDTIQSLYGRLFSCLYNTRYIIVKETIKKYAKQYAKEYGNYAFMPFELGFGDIDKIKNKIEKYKPALVIIDMADVLCPGDESTLLIKRVYDTLRQYANKYCPIIATSQTRDTSYWSEKEGKMCNKKWLAMGDLYNSKVGKPGSATTIVGIAKDMDIENIRYIHTPKNKGFQKIKAVAEIDEQTSYYREME